MTATANALDTFREASLRSGLVSTSQWSAACEPLALPSTLSTDQQTAACDKIATRLIEQEILTEYQSQQLRAGRTKLSLGPYRVTHWLGQGGMGQVFGGVHEIMGRQCAIKVLPLAKSNDRSRESFIREIRLQASLDSPYLVRAFDAGRDGQVHYLVTEYIDGTDLRRLVKQHGRLTMQQSASIIAQAAAGLEYAHRRGLIHRDVKPANILVTHDGHAKVSDVGLAAWAHGQEEAEREGKSVGKVVGTADFLSPEAIRTPDHVGPASDIYSLGCTLYYACTGHLPYPGGDVRSKCRRHLLETPLHPKKLAPELSDAFVETIADMIDKDPMRRVASAAEVVHRLSPWAAAVLPTIEALGAAQRDELGWPTEPETMNGPEANRDADPDPNSDDFWIRELGLSAEDEHAVSRVASASTWQVAQSSKPENGGPLSDDAGSQVNLDEPAPAVLTLSDIHRDDDRVFDELNRGTSSTRQAVPLSRFPAVPPPVAGVPLQPAVTNDELPNHPRSSRLGVILAVIASGLAGAAIGWLIRGQV